MLNKKLLQDLKDIQDKISYMKINTQMLVPTIQAAIRSELRNDNIPLKLKNRISLQCQRFY